MCFLLPGTYLNNSMCALRAQENKIVCVLSLWYAKSMALSVMFRRAERSCPETTDMNAHCEMHVQKLVRFISNAVPLYHQKLWQNIDRKTMIKLMGGKTSLKCSLVHTSRIRASIARARPCNGVPMAFERILASPRSRPIMNSVASIMKALTVNSASLKPWYNSISTARVAPNATDGTAVPMRLYKFGSTSTAHDTTCARLSRPKRAMDAPLPNPRIAFK